MRTLHYLTAFLLVICAVSVAQEAREFNLFAPPGVEAPPDPMSDSFDLFDAIEQSAMCLFSDDVESLFGPVAISAEIERDPMDLFGLQETKPVPKPTRDESPVDALEAIGYEPPREPRDNLTHVDLRELPTVHLYVPDGTPLDFLQDPAVQRSDKLEVRNDEQAFRLQVHKGDPSAFPWHIHEFGKASGYPVAYFSSEGQWKRAALVKTVERLAELAGK